MEEKVAAVLGFVSSFDDDEVVKLTDEELNQVPPSIRPKVKLLNNRRPFPEADGPLTVKTVQAMYNKEIATIKETIEKQLIHEKELREKAEADLSVKSLELEQLQQQFSVMQKDDVRLKIDNARFESEARTATEKCDELQKENSSLQLLLSKRENELERLQNENKVANEKLEEAIMAKLDALSDIDQYQTKKIEMEYKEKRFEEEKAIMTRQINLLTQDITKHSEEIIILRRENVSNLIDLQEQLSRKTQEIKVLTDNEENSKKTIEKLLKQIDQLKDRLIGFDDDERKVTAGYHKEIECQTKLTNIYKEISEDSGRKTEELVETIKQLQQVIQDLTEKCDEFKSKNENLRLIIDNMERSHGEDLSVVKKELKAANTLIETLQNCEIEKLSPHAAAAYNLIKKGLSLTQMYSEYSSLSEQLYLKTEENKQLNVFIDTVLKDLRHKAPILQKQKDDYAELMKTVDNMSKFNGGLENEIVALKLKLREAEKKASTLDRDNHRMKSSIADLSRQICFLLKEVEESRGGNIPMTAISQASVQNMCEPDGSAANVVNDHLVTFRDIEDMQKANQRLLAIVRELSASYEEAERMMISNQEENSKELKEKVDKLEATLRDMTETCDRQEKLLGITKNQAKVYRMLYNQQIAGNPIPPVAVRLLNSENLNEDEQMIVEDTSTDKIDSYVQTVPIDTDHVKELKNLQDQLSALTAEYNEFKEESAKSEKELMKTLEESKEKLKKVTWNASELLLRTNTNEEKYKSAQLYADTLKQQMTALESKCTIYSQTIGKHEEAIAILRTEAMNANAKLARAEVLLQNANTDCTLLRQSESRLRVERDILLRDKQCHENLMLQMESIKDSIDRSEAEWTVRMDEKLDSALKESSALRKRLQEEQDKQQERTSYLQSALETSTTRLNEVKSMNQHLLESLDMLKSLIDQKDKALEELGEKLSSVSSKNIIEMEVTILTLQRDLSKKEEELRAMGAILNMAKSDSKEISDMSEKFEKKLREQSEEHTQYKKRMEAKATELAGEVAGLRHQNNALGKQLSDLSNMKNGSLTLLNEEITSTSKKVDELQKELKEAQDRYHLLDAEVKLLTKEKLTTEKKYADEMIQHTIDVAELRTMTDKLMELENRISVLTTEKDKALQQATLSNKKWEDREAALKLELNEQTSRLNDTLHQNELLYKQLDEVRMKMNKSSNLNVSVPSTSVNISESTNQGNLYELITYLKREKSRTFCQLELSQKENIRIKSEYELVRTQLEESKKLLDAERDKSDISSTTAQKHAELIAKVEMLSALTDSNRLLREERNKAREEYLKMQEKLHDLESRTLSPLRGENQILQTQIEKQTQELAQMTSECVRLKTREAEYVEKLSKNNVDELTRAINLERENHNKTLEDLRAVKQEKTKIEDQLKKLQTSRSERIVTLEKERAEFQKELDESKSKMEKISQDFDELKKTFAAQEQAMSELRTSNSQLRIIAKKYRNQYTEMVKSVEEEKKKQEAAAAANVASAAGEEPEISIQDQERLRQEGRQQSEAALNERLKQLTEEAAMKQRKVEELIAENKALKTSVVDKDNHCKELLKQARSRMLVLSNSNKKFQHEMDLLKKKLENESATRDEGVARQNVIKSSLENRIAKLEKEKSDLQADRDRIARDLEVLNQRVSVLQRQLSTQQVSKSSTTMGQEKSTSEPPTANIKPTKSQQGQQSVTVTPWRSATETPLASIRPMTMQSRTVAVLPTSQTSCNVSQSTVVVPPQQQMVDTISSATNIVDSFSPSSSSSSSSSSHADYNMPTTSSAVCCVIPTQQASHSAESTQSQPPTVALVLPRIESQSVLPQTQQHTIGIEPMVASSQTPISMVSASSQSEQSTSSGSGIQKKADTCYQQDGDDSNPGQVSASHTQQQAVSSIETAPEQSVAVASSHPFSSSEHSSKTAAAAEPSVIVASSNANSSNTVTTTQAGLKRQRDAEGESSKTSSSGVPAGPQQQPKRARVHGMHEDPFSGDVDEGSSSQMLLRCSGLDVEYQVPTSSQRDQEYDSVLMIDSEGEDDELDEQAMPDDGIIDEGDENANDYVDEEDDAENDNVYELDDQDLSMNDYGIDGPDIDEDSNPTNDQNNEVEIMMDEESNEVPNQSEGSENLMTVRSSSDQQRSEATSSGNNAPGSSNNSTLINSRADTIASILNQLSRRPSIISPINRQQAQTLILSQGYEDNTGDDGIVPSTPTLFIPRRSDGFSEAVSSPHVPSGGRFTFSDTSTQTTRAGVAQVVSEGMDDTRMDLSQLDENNRTGRSVPTTPLQVSPRGIENSEIGQSEEDIQAPIEEQAETSHEPQIEQPNEDILEDIIAPAQPELDLEELEGSASGDLIIDEQLEAAEQVGIDPLESNEAGVSSEGNQVTSQPGPSTSKQPVEDEGREAEAAATGTASSDSLQRKSTVNTGTARRSVRLAVRGRGGGRNQSTPWDLSNQPETRSSVMRGRGGDLHRPSYRGRGRRPRGWGPYSRY